MHQWNLTGAAICLIALATSSANAGPFPSLTLSSPANLSALTVGQTVEIDVNLSSLPANDFIFNLNSKVLFSSSLFMAVPDPTSTSGLTATVTPGSVFYNFANGPDQVFNFNSQSSLTAGAAIGIFSESPRMNSGAIGLNGLYYSFLLKATSAGSGSIQFDSTPGANEYAANDTNFNYAPFNPLGGPLAFTIRPAASVPEPSSFALVAVGVAVVGGWTRARGRSAARA